VILDERFAAGSSALGGAFAGKNSVGMVSKKKTMPLSGAQRSQPADFIRPLSSIVWTTDPTSSPFGRQWPRPGTN